MAKRADVPPDYREMIGLLRAGKVDALSDRVRRALAAGVPAEDVLNGALIPGMRELGEDFKRNRIYVPEVLIASRAMKEAMALLEPALIGKARVSRGTVVIGAVAGDLHDIGKNLVATLTRGAGDEIGRASCRERV